MELKILYWINNNMHNNQIMNNIWGFFSRISDSGLIWILFILILLCFKSTRKLGGVLALSFAINTVAGFVIKNLIVRQRSFEEDSVFISFLNSISYPLPDSYSFPSGHTSTAFVIFFTIYQCDKKLSLPTFLLALIISFSRLFLCVHYPTDIIAGILLGGVVSILSVYTYNKFVSFYLKHYKNKTIVNNSLYCNYCGYYTKCKNYVKFR